MTMKTLSQLLKTGEAERKPAGVSEDPVRLLSEAELDYVAGGRITNIRANASVIGVAW
jgi:hypothetical protein